MFLAHLFALCFALACPDSAARNSASVSPLLKDAEARIERIRKADATIVVVGRNGKPIRNAKVKAEQTGSAFLFGCAALSLNSHADAAQEATYEKRFGDLFNFATVLTYWQDTEPEEGRLNFAKLTAQVEILRRMGIRVKGHPLYLAGACPRWVPVDPDAARELTKKRIRDLVGRFRGKIEVWDVVGDATSANGAQNGLGAWARKAGSAALTADALTWAREADPDALLLYNEYNLDDKALDLVRALVKAKAPLDTVGLEAHETAGDWPLEKVWEKAETFGKLSKPLHFSEITVLSDDPKADHSKAWPTTPEGERRQADYVEALYTLLFSHPDVKAIGWWNFVDGDWDRNPGGLLRSDLSPKPAYDRLYRLIREKWRTTADLMTDRKGKATFRGFAGRYRITAQTLQGTVVVESDLRLSHRNVISLRIP